MPNPVFLIVLLFIAYASIISVTDYFRGLKIFFCYLMLAGFLKRLMSVFGTPSGIEYSLFVGFALILFTSVLLGFILQKKHDRHYSPWAKAANGVVRVSASPCNTDHRDILQPVTAYCITCYFLSALLLDAGISDWLHAQERPGA